MTLRILVPVLGTLILLVGCRAHYSSEFQVENTSPGQIYETISKSIDAIGKFEGDATITIDTPEQSGRINSRVILHPGSVIEIMFRTPFGGKMGTLEIRDTYVVFFDTESRIQYIGPPEDAGIPGLPALVQGEHSPVSMVVGLLNLPTAVDNYSRAELTGEQLYIVQYSGKTVTQSYTVNPAIRRVVEYTESQKNEGELLRIELSRFTKFQGIQLPRSITVTQPREKRFISIYYHNIQLMREPDVSFN